MRARALVLLGLLVPAAAEEERPKPSPYSDLGFPVTFDDAILTANDVARFLDLPLDAIDPKTLETQRNMLIYRKLGERIAAQLAIGVDDREVDEQIRRETNLHGGDAKFFEWLAQQGTTLERYKLETRQRILEEKLRFLFVNGVTHDSTQLLPWRVRPTPREIEIAFRNDPARASGAVRVRRLEFVVDADRDFRGKVAAQQALGKSEEWVKEQLASHIKPKADAAVAALKARAFPDVAREHGADVDAMQKQWLVIAGTSEAERFLAEAKGGTTSAPIALPGGAVLFVHLLEREDPTDRKANDPGVAEEYDRRIRLLRASKWQTILRLRALDGATMEPERVREEVRNLLLAALRESEEGLRVLGLR
jgi:hypothetical protein